jgi:hypothetical protein
LKGRVRANAAGCLDQCEHGPTVVIYPEAVWYGGVAPEDVVSGYIVLIAVALGLGAFGLMCSSLVKRTTAATAITIFGVLGLTIGTAFILIFWAAMGTFDQNGNRTSGPFGIKSPTILAYVNPFLAQADVLCGTEATFGGAGCSGVQALAPSNDGLQFVQNGNGGFIPGGVPIAVPAPNVIVDDTGGKVIGVGIGGDGAGDVAPAAAFAQRDALWPKTVVTWLILSVVFLALSVQFVSPTRRWHLRRRSRSKREPVA